MLATALLRLFPDAKLDIGPPTDTGFYYDIDLEHKLTVDDLAKLEAEMKKIAEENQRLKSAPVPAPAAPSPDPACPCRCADPAPAPVR